MLLLFKIIFLNYFIFTYILVVQANDNLLIKEWKCANRHCTVPISNGEAKREYKNPDHDLKLKFKHLDKLTVLRKPFDDKADYWWIRLEDDENLEGYANKNFIKETKVLTNNNALIKVTENELNPNSSISPTSPKGYDVVDGTTIYGYDGVPSPLVDNSLPVDNSNVVNTTESEKEDVDDDGEVEIEDEGDSSVFEAISSQYEKLPPVDTVKSSDIEPENSSKSDEINSANSIETDSIVSLPSAPESITTSSPDISQETSDQSLSNQTLNDTVSEELQNVGKINENAYQDGILSSTVSEELQNVGKINENAYQDGILSSTVIEKLQNDGKLNENANQNDILSSTLSEKLQNAGKTNENANQDGILSSTVSEKLQNDGKLNENANQDDILSSTLSEKLQNVGKLNENANQDDILSSTTESSMNSSVNLNETENKEDIVYNSESSPSPLVNDNNEKHIDIQPLNENVIANTIEKLQNNETNTLPSENNTNESDSTTTESINLAESEKSFSSTELPTYSVDTNLSSDISKSKNISIESSVSEESTKSTTEVNFIENNVPQPEQIVKDYDNINNYTQSFDNIPVEKKELDPNNIDPPKLEANDYPYPVTTEAIPLDVHQNEEHTEYDKSIETLTETIVPDEIQLTTEIPNYYKSEDVTEPVAAVDDNQILESPPVEDNKIIEESKPVVPDIIEENVEDSSQNWFSSVYSLMDSVKELYLSTVGTNINAENNLVNEEIVETFKNISPEKCDEQSSDEYCMKKKVDESSTSSLQDSEPMPETLQPELNSNFDDSNNNSWPSFKSLFWIIISTHVILCFSLGYYYLDNWKRDCELVQKNNILAGDLFVLEREKTILEEEFSVLKEDMQKILQEKTVIDNEIDSIKEELRKTKEEKQNAEEKELKLVKKLKMIEQNYNELRKIFSESKQKGDRSALIADIKKLKDSIAEYNVEISALKEELQEKKNEIKQLNVNLQKSNEAKMALQERFDKLVIEGQEVAKGYQETLSKMEQTIEENKTVQTNLEKDLRKHKKKCESLEIEKELAESALHKAHGITSAESLADWLEVKEVRCSLLAAQKEISKLSTERDSLSQRLDSVEEKCKSLSSEVVQLTEKYETVEREKVDALTKLEVLTDHFEAKEKKIQEEYAMKEVEWLKKQSDENAIFQQLLDLREENSTLKNMVESLKKEIVDQEASYKKIINTTEQKAHENWVTFRRTEIRLKEVQAEAAQLRNRLASLEVGDENSEEKLNKVGLEVNGDLPPIGSAMSPPFMLHPNEFIPPPPLVQLPPGANPTSRPPPLGRISSPPLVSGDFIPPPPLLPPYDVYPHVHQNPPSPSHIPPPLLHKPQPREHLHHHMGQQSQISPQRKQKDSQSSNQSSESPHDKTPARRNKR